MKHLQVVLILFLVVVFSCNNSNKEKEKQIEETKAKELFRKIENKNDIYDYIKVQLEAIVEKGDNFQLFYSEDYQLSYSQKEMITVPVKGEMDVQKIVFNVPQNVFPERYRFDVGSNPNQEEISIKSLKVSYKNWIIDIPSDSISKYLIPNIYITPRDEQGNYLLNRIEQKGILPYDPYFTCSPELIRLLLKL